MNGSLARPWPLSRIADRFGAAASSLCAVHCALLPVVVALLPALGLGFLADPRFERGFIAFASVLAISMAVIAFRRHRNPRAFWFLVPGITLLLTGAFIGFDHHLDAAGNLGHALTVSAGGALVAIAHLVNLRMQALRARGELINALRR
jgi:hypothetical protein